MRFARRRAGSSRFVAFAPLLAAVALLAAALAPAVVSAHARLTSSSPAAGATLGSGPAAVTLTFSETPDVRLTIVKVLDSGGTDHVSGPVVAAPDPAATVSAPLGTLADGVYTVSWRAVSAVDGHISAGSFVFGVGAAPPSAAPDQGTASLNQGGSPPAIAARWLLYLGFMALFGAAWVALAVARGPVRDLLAMAAVGWVLTALGTVAVVAVQWAETGAPLETLPSTSIGAAALARVLSLGLVAVALAGLAVVPALAGGRGWALVAVAAGVAVVADVVTGHAAAGPGWILQVIAQAAHGLAAAAWVGGLAGLLVVLRTTPDGERLAAARRYSSWAGIALAIVALTGVARAYAELGTLDALVGTDFGHVVIAKSALLFALAGLGALNRFIHLRSAAFLPRLRRVGLTEVVVAIAVLGLSAVLVNEAPPASAGGPVAPAAQPIVAIGNDLGTSVRARLVASPGSTGTNAFELALTDYDLGAPADASAVKVRFENASLAGISPTTLDLTRSGPGQYSASGPDLSIDGIWKLTVTATFPGGAVAIPLVAATQVADQAVSQLVSPGVPTIYQVNLGAIGSAQVYLDPGGPGKNDLHATFFDASGNEQPIDSATIAAFPGGQPGTLLAARMLEPGHFTAAIDAVAGPLTLDVVTPLPAGRGTGQIHLHVTIEVTP